MIKIQEQLKAEKSRAIIGVFVYYVDNCVPMKVPEPVALILNGKIFQAIRKMVENDKSLVSFSRDQKKELCKR